jgi:hypothetical protein
LSTQNEEGIVLGFVLAVLGLPAVVGYLTRLSLASGGGWRTRRIWKETVLIDARCFKKIFTIVFYMLVYGECYENVYA